MEIVPHIDTKLQYPIDIDEIKSRVTVLDLAQADGLRLKRAGALMTCCCQIHDEKMPSFVIYPGDRGFFCYGCGAGGSVIDYLMQTRRIGIKEALAQLAGRAVDMPPTRRPAHPKQTSELVYRPVLAPLIAPPPFTRHYQHGQSIARWTYHNATGRVMAYVLRFHEHDESGNPIFDVDGNPKKTDRPLTWGIGKHGSFCWNWKGWPAPKPLFNLHLLTAHPDRPAIVCEGEKSATAAATMLPDWIATCSMNGAVSPHLTDWTPLRARKVFVWPDADNPGAAYAAAAVKLTLEAGAASVEVLEFAL